jgi:HK97 family phage prohead protease
MEIVMKNEIRAGQPAEVRADSDGVIKVAGYAAVFNEAATIAGAFHEIIEPGAFRESLESDDVVFLINHGGLPLARTRSGTLSLKEDERGLYIESELDAADPDVMSIVPKMKRGDLDKMSFAFITEIEEWDETGEVPTRTVKKAAVRDVSIVTNPAYEGTEIGLRSLDAHRAQHRKNAQGERRKRVLAAQLSQRID